MKTLSIAVVFLMIASAAAQEPKPTAAVCKADLKVWSAQKTETLTIPQIDERMGVMVACAPNTT